MSNITVSKLTTSVKNNAKQFCKRFCVYASMRHYARYVLYTLKFFASVDIIQTCEKTYRVIVYVSYFELSKCAQYKSFSSVSSLCSYLDTLSGQLV